MVCVAVGDYIYSYINTRKRITVLSLLGGQGGGGEGMYDVCRWFSSMS